MALSPCFLYLQHTAVLLVGDLRIQSMVGVMLCMVRVIPSDALKGGEGAVERASFYAPLIAQVSELLLRIADDLMLVGNLEEDGVVSVSFSREILPRPFHISQGLPGLRASPGHQAARIVVYYLPRLLCHVLHAR